MMDGEGAAVKDALSGVEVGIKGSFQKQLKTRGWLNSKVVHRGSFEGVTTLPPKNFNQYLVENLTNSIQKKIIQQCSERDYRSYAPLYFSFPEEFHVSVMPPNFYQNLVPL